jgi:hypothetical protein
LITVPLVVHGGEELKAGLRQHLEERRRAGDA